MGSILSQLDNMSTPDILMIDLDEPAESKIKDQPSKSSSSAITLSLDDDLL